jgi:hypothetical protein
MQIYAIFEGNKWGSEIDVSDSFKTNYNFICWKLTYIVKLTDTGCLI